MYSSIKITLLLVSLSLIPPFSFAEIPTIGVIGGGIGGTATAYFLRQLFGANKVNIHLYERERIGGRLATVPVGSSNYETGGSIIHSRNKYMQSFVKTFGLKHRNTMDRRMGLYSGDEFVFEDSNWSLINYFKLLKRYGLGLFKVNNKVEKMLKSFDRIYAAQNKGEAFYRVEELLYAMDPDFPKFTNVSALEGFKSFGFPSTIIDELISAAAQVNYGQPPSELHTLVGMVSIAGCTGKLWAVEGGNDKVPLGLLEYSGAQLFSKNVLKVGLETNGKLTLTIDEKSIPKRIPQVYDMIIISAPQANNIKSNIDLSDFESQGWLGEYHRTVSTILSGRLNHSFFGYSQEEEVPEEILLTSNKYFFNSVGRLDPVEGESNETDVKVWKVFSTNLLTDAQLRQLFVEHDANSIRINDWHAYPRYKEPRANDSFLIHDNVFYLNAIEWAASAMEMSAIGAKNVALLAYNSYSEAAGNRKGRHKHDMVSGTPKTEL